MYALGVTFLANGIIKNNLVFIGGGNLAEAIFSKISALNLYNISVTQRNSTKLAQLQAKYPHIIFFSNLNIELSSQDIVFICVKPQDAKNTCNELKYLLTKPTIVSVMAGVSIDSLTSWCSNSQIIRAMPNVLATIGYGVTGVFCNDNITKTRIDNILSIFNTLGKTFILDNEDYINKITTAAASSPAYVFYFLEALISSLIKLGFNKDMAQEIILQVSKGSLALLDTNINEKSISELRQSITSKNGTTQAAIQVLEQSGFNEIINNAIIAGYNRANELSTIDT